MILFKEYEFVKNIIDSNVPPLNLSIKKTILYVAKYYYNEDYKLQEYICAVLNKMKEFNFESSYYEEHNYIDYIKNICKKLLNQEIPHELKQIDSVDIYNAEIEQISKCESKQGKKLLFTLCVLAKTTTYKTGWVNYELNDIFELANLDKSISEKKKGLMMYELYKNGFIQQSHKNDQFGYYIPIETNKDKNEIAITITDFKNLGNQYIVHVQPGYKLCQICGRVIKCNSIQKRNRQKYCKRCAYEVQKEQIKAYDRKEAEKNKQKSKSRQQEKLKKELKEELI